MSRFRVKTSREERKLGRGLIVDGTEYLDKDSYRLGPAVKRVTTHGSCLGPRVEDVRRGRETRTGPSTGSYAHTGTTLSSGGKT